MDDLTGQTFAGYEILAKLGQGGFGAVYKARETELQRIVALKVLSSDLATDMQFIGRFQREARVAAGFDNPNLVRVFEAGESNGTHFIAMEFVEGESVQQRLNRESRIEPTEALAICVHVAEALAYAWRKAQVIHRDIKPDNIFLSNAGEVKLGDLGLAKRAGSQTTAVTQTGFAIGTPHYISPEQARGLPNIDFRADIYSLGCTLFHMLTGQLPYTGTDPMGVMMKHVNEPPPGILKVWPQCPMPLVFLVGKMVAKHPTERPQSYEQLLTELYRVHDQLERPATASRYGLKAPAAVLAAAQRAAARVTPVPKKKSRAGVVVAAAAVLALAAGGWWWMQQQNVGGASAPRLAGASVTAGRGAEAPPTFQKPVAADAFVREVAALPAEQQIARVLAEMTRLNPGFDPVAAGESHKIEGGVVVGLKFSTEMVSDISPLRALTGLKSLHAEPPGGRRSPLADLSPLRGLPLTILQIARTHVSDLLPLRGMPLFQMNITQTDVTDLSPLAGLPLKKLFADIAPYSDLSPLRGMPLDLLWCGRTKVTDFSVMKELPLRSVNVSYDKNLHADLLRAIPTLTSINMKPAAEFWKKAEENQPVEPPATDTAATPGVINLLRLIEPDKDAVSGTWTLQDGALRSSGGHSVIELPYAPPQEYDLLVHFTRLAGSDVVQLLARAEREFGWNLGSYGNTLAALGRIRGLAQNLGPVAMPHTLENNRRYESLVSIRNDGFKAFLDGQLVAEWRTDFSDMQPVGEWRTRTRAVLGLGASGRTIFHRVELTEITGTGKLTRPDSAAAIETAKPPPVATTAQPEVSPPSSAGKRVLNLLPVIEPQTDAVAGTWTVQDKTLVSDSTTHARIELPYQPPAEYDFVVGFTRMSGNGDVAQMLAKAGHDFSWHLSAYDNTLAILGCIGGRFQDSPAAVPMEPRLENQRRYTSQVAVRNDGVKVYLDGKLITQWKTDYSDLSYNGAWRLHNPSLLGVGSWGSRTIFHRIEVIEVTGTGKFTRPEAAAKAIVADDIAALPPEQQLQRVMAKLKELNPKFDGRETHKIETVARDSVAGIPPRSGGLQNAITELTINTAGITDISPLSALTGLKKLTLMPWTAGAHSPLADLWPLQGLALTFLACGNTQVADLGPLRGMPLTVLSCDGTAVKDLSPIEAAPLTVLWCNNSKVTDLAPVIGKPLRELRADAVLVSQFSGPLRAMPSLEKINDIPAKAFWLRFGGGTAARKTQATPAAASLDPKQDMLVAAMKPEEQVAWFVEAMKKLNPKFDGKETHKIEKGRLTALTFSTKCVTNIFPVSSLKTLVYLNCSVSGRGGTLTDLSPLRGLALKRLHCHGNDNLTDLSPLAGLPLVALECWNSRVSEFSPLRGKAMELLVFYNTLVSDLSPLKGMPLTHLHCWFTRVKDLSPLAGMPLTEVACWGTPVSDLRPLKGMSLKTLKIPNTPVKDLSVVAGMPLQTLEFELALLKQHGAMLRGMKTLKTINKIPAADFWKRADAGNPPKAY